MNLYTWRDNDPVNTSDTSGAPLAPRRSGDWWIGTSVGCFTEEAIIDMNRRTGEAKMLRGACWSIGPGLLLMASPALAQSETTTYTYDALGRLVGSTVANGQNNGVRTVIAYDPAGNRKTYTVSGAPSAGTNDPDGGSSVPHRATFVVVPLNGYTLIPIP